MVPLKPTELDYAHHVRLQFVARPAPGTTLAEVTDPGFWSSHTHRLKPGSIIEVLSEDNSLDCELRVLEVGQTYAKVRVLRNFIADANASQHELPNDIEVGYGGKAEKWRVVHKGQVGKAGMTTREDAEKAAEEYRLKFAA